MSTGIPPHGTPAAEVLDQLESLRGGDVAWREGRAFSLAYLAGNVAIPGAILTGVLQPAAGTVAAQRIAASPAPQR